MAIGTNMQRREAAKKAWEARRKRGPGAPSGNYSTEFLERVDNHIQAIEKKEKVGKRAVIIEVGKSKEEHLKELGRGFFKQYCISCGRFLKESRRILQNLHAPCRQFRHGIKYKNKKTGWVCKLLEVDGDVDKKDKERTMRRIQDDELDNQFIPMGEELVQCRRREIGH